MSATQNNAKKNLLHLAALSVWAVMGVVFTARCLFGGGSIMANVFAAGSFWLWFAGFAALTSVVIGWFEATAAALLVHASAFVFLAALPPLFPLSLLRLGYDLLNRGHV